MRGNIFKEISGLIVAAMFVMTGCSGGGSDGSTKTPPAQTETPKEQVVTLENSGIIPKLDRSTNIKGPDTNTNGIRDDVDTYIATMPITPVQKKSVVQFAQSIQTSIVVDTTNATKVREASADISRAVQCISIKFPDIKMRTTATNEIESVTANTKERAAQYIKFNNALSGSVSKLLSGDTCNE